VTRTGAIFNVLASSDLEQAVEAAGILPKLWWWGLQENWRCLWTSLCFQRHTLGRSAVYVSGQSAL